MIEDRDMLETLRHCEAGILKVRNILHDLILGTGIDTVYIHQNVTQYIASRQGGIRINSKLGQAETLGWK